MKAKLPTDRLIILPVPEKDTTESGLFIVRFKKESMRKGIIVSRGTSVEHFKDGDTVLYNHVGSEIEIDGQKHIIIQQDQIITGFDEPTAVLQEN